MIHPRGDFNSPVWVLQYAPSDEDVHNQVSLSGTRGWAFDKLLDQVQLPVPHIRTVWQDPSLPETARTKSEWLSQLISVVDLKKPPLLLLYGETITELLLPELKSYKKPFKVSLEKQAGNLYQSAMLKYPHFCIPLQTVDFVWANYAYRDIYCNLDLGKAKDELDYYIKNRQLQSLPEYEFILEPVFPVLIDYLDYCLSCSKLSIDIETIRPPKGKKCSFIHPGYPYTLGIADSSKRGCSFSLWDYSPDELVSIWKKINQILSNDKIIQIGQNYFNFDTHFLEALGFSVNLEMVQDTMIRQHILWPELPRKLQFLTKQYTRQPFYKDEGKQWNPKQKKSLMHYNVLDVCVTMEVWEAQEAEFAARPHLK